MGEIITIEGIDAKCKAIEAMRTDDPQMKRELRRIIKDAIGEARKRIVKDAQSALENDPRQAYRAVRNSVYKQIFGGQVNILSPRRRGAATRYVKPRKLDDNPHQRGGNRRRRSERTMQVESYHGKDRGFILRFLQMGTSERHTIYGNRGSIRARDWFGISSAFQMEAAATQIAQEIENLLGAEFKYI